MSTGRIQIQFIGSIRFETGKRKKMASADLEFTKDGLIYRSQHQEDEDDDFLTERPQKDGGSTRQQLHAALGLHNLHLA